MAEYIDREQALEALCIGCLDGCSKHCAEYTRLKSVPSADVRENVHGHWRKMNYDLGYECSECGWEASNPWDFCPNCGADMR